MIKDVIDDLLLKVSADREPDVIKVNPSWYRELLKVSRPSVYVLHNAAWRSGYSVNGIRPESQT